MKALLVAAALLATGQAAGSDTVYHLARIPVVNAEKVSLTPVPLLAATEAAAPEPKPAALAAGDYDAIGVVEESGSPWTVAGAVVGSVIGVTTLIALVAFVILPRRRGAARGGEEDEDDGDFLRSLRGHQNLALRRVRGYEEVVPAPGKPGPLPTGTQSLASLRTALPGPTATAAFSTRARSSSSCASPTDAPTAAAAASDTSATDVSLTGIPA